MKWWCLGQGGSKDRRTAVQCNHACGQCSSYSEPTYNSLAWDKRLFFLIPRGTDLWATYYKQRTAPEPINKRYNDYGLDTTRVKASHASLQIAALAAMNMHLDAWLWRLDKQQTDRQTLTAEYLHPTDKHEAA